MNSERPRHSIVVLFCTDALALALGALLVDQPANASPVMAEHRAGLEKGSVLAIMATSGENYLWPVRGAA